MKKVVVLAMSLSFVASMAMAQAVDPAKQAAINQLQTVSPQTTLIAGVPVAAASLGAILALIAAIAAGSGGGSSSSSSSSSST